MARNEIDSLIVKVKTEADGSSNGISNLIKDLSLLSKTLSSGAGGLTMNLNALSTQLKNLSRSIDNSTISKIDNLSNSLKNLSMNSSNIGDTAQTLDKISNSLNNLQSSSSNGKISIDIKNGGASESLTTGLAVGSLLDSSDMESMGVERLDNEIKILHNDMLALKDIPTFDSLKKDLIELTDMASNWEDNLNNSLDSGIYSETIGESFVEIRTKLMEYKEALKAVKVNQSDLFKELEKKDCLKNFMQLWKK